MRKDVLEQAPEPFFTTKTEERGTGLGLSSVRNFAVETGGFVVIESHEGEGTAVRIYLPRTQQAPAAKNQSVEKTDIPLGDGECVLVVEDDERVRDVTLKRIEALGYVAEQARSGSEAFALLRSGLPIDLVLSDIVMPGAMSGLDLARRVRAEMPTIGFACWRPDSAGSPWKKIRRLMCRSCTSRIPGSNSPEVWRKISTNGLKREKRRLRIHSRCHERF